MNKQAVNIYFNNITDYLTFGNFQGSPNEIDDNQMYKLEAWLKSLINICEILNKNGDRYIIIPNNISYIQIIKQL